MPCQREAADPPDERPPSGDKNAGVLGLGFVDLHLAPRLRGQAGFEDLHLKLVLELGLFALIGDQLVERAFDDIEDGAYDGYGHFTISNSR